MGATGINNYIRFDIYFKSNIKRIVDKVSVKIKILLENELSGIIFLDLTGYRIAYSKEKSNFNH